MSNMSVFIQAYFIEDKPGFFCGEGKKTIDGERLNTDLQMVLDALSKENHLVVSITPITSSDYQTMGNHAYGISYTEGLIVVARKA